MPAVNGLLLIRPDFSFGKDVAKTFGGLPSDDEASRRFTRRLAAHCSNGLI